MFVAVERLLMRVRQPASRADEIVVLRARARMERAAPVDDEEIALAREVHVRKLAVAEVVGAVSACGSCAKHQAWPVGAHAGGACCSGTTATLFDDAELAALTQAGTQARDLVPPPASDPHAGCAFRGASACSLRLVDRPARCVHFACTDLRRELHAHGRLDAVEAALAALADAVARHTAAQRARADREVLAPLVAALGQATRRP